MGTAKLFDQKTVALASVEEMLISVGAEITSHRQALGQKLEEFRHLMIQKGVMPRILKRSEYKPRPITVRKKPEAARSSRRATPWEMSGKRKRDASDASVYSCLKKSQEPITVPVLMLRTGLCEGTVHRSLRRLLRERKVVRGKTPPMPDARGHKLPRVTWLALVV